jgi:Rho termination factor, N-terminal domain
MTNDHYEEKYTDPDLRRRLKEEIMQSDKGGQPGQWSARKSQMLVREYEAQGGGYLSNEKDEAARSLEEWESQDWQTEAGDDRAREGKVTKRYLPKAVWDILSESEKQEAERIKEEASQQGIQHVDWTPAVKQAMHKYEQTLQPKHQSQEHENQTKQELYEQAKKLNIPGRSKMNRDELIEAIDQVSSQVS